MHASRRVRRVSRAVDCLLLLASISAPAVSLFADTIYQANAQGKQVVIQRDAIVVKDDPSFLVYKHFDLKEQRVVKVVLNKGSLPYEVNPSAPEARRQIVEIETLFTSAYLRTKKFASSGISPVRSRSVGRKFGTTLRRK